MNHKPGSVSGQSRLLPSVLKSRCRPLSAVYPRLTGGQPAIKGQKANYLRIFDFAPDEACRSGTVANAEVGSYPAFSPLSDH